MSAASTLRPVSAELVGEVVRLERADGEPLELHRLALRDGCPCPDCRHPVSGQRLFETASLVPHAQIASVQLEDGVLGIAWRDGHTSHYDPAWLEAAREPYEGRRPVTLWGRERAAELPEASYDDVVADRAELRRFLQAVAELGFAVLRDAPCEPGTVAEVAELFGPVRVTNYGRTFDVAIKVDAANLADTSLPLGLHTDNPYRSPAPTLQLLQCLVSSAAGGDTILADGFRAVTQLRDESPGLLAILARTPIVFGYRDHAAELEASVPIVVLDRHDRPVAIHLNNRSKGVPAGAPYEVEEWYEAYFHLIAILERPEAQVVFRLEPGDVAVFDNLRVLHARTGFAGEGDRRLQGCYADRDGLLSTLAVLEREAA